MSLISSILSFLGSISSIFSFFLEKEKYKEATLRYIRSDLIEMKDDFNELSKTSIDKILKIIKRINKLNINYKDESELNDILEDIMELLNDKLFLIFSYENIEDYFIHKFERDELFDFKSFEKELKDFNAYTYIFRHPKLRKYLNEDFIRGFSLKEEFYNIKSYDFME
jgi:hypothetical protein